MKELILTVGLPRSGKSTWAQTTGFPMVNPDSIRLALHGQAFQPEAEPMVWTMARYMVRSLFLAGHDRVVLDATNVTKRRRQEWMSSEWATKFKEFNASKEVCTQRAIDNNQQCLVPVIERMAKQMEPLTSDERIRLYDPESGH